MEREKGEASNLEVSFSALRKDVANVLYLMERLKNEEDQKSVYVNLIEKLKFKLSFICTYVQLSYSDLEHYEDIMIGKRQEVENLLRPILDNVDNKVRCKYNTHHVIPSLINNMDDCISSHHHFKSNATMMDEQLDFLLLNLHHLSKYRAEKMMVPLATQYEILQNVCGNVKDFHGLIVNGCIKHDMAENILPLFQLMAERVGHFLWEDQIDEDSQLSELDEDDQTDEDAQLSELAKDDQTDEDMQFSILAEDNQTDEDGQLSELDEDEQTNEDAQLSKLAEDDQTDEDVQLSELAKDDQADEAVQLSDLAEDDQTDEDMQLSELAKDDQADEAVQLSELAKDDQADEDVQLSELAKDDQADEALQLSKLAEDDQTDEDVQLSELAKDDQADEAVQLSDLAEDDQTDEDAQLSDIAEDDQTDEDVQHSGLAKDDQNDRDSRLFKLAHLLLKIVPIELEVMHICYTNLKASTSAEVGCFIKQLLETSPDILRECLIHLQEHMVTVITASTPGARNIHVMMEFLLIILTDVPGDLIHHDKLFDLLARVGVLTMEVLTLVHGLEEKSVKKESTDETNSTTLDLQENIELLKKELKHVYLKAPNSSQCCFPMSDGPLFMHLLHIHLNDLLDSNAYSVVLIQEEIVLVKQGLESIRSFFVNVEQGLYKDLWAHVLDVVYEAKDVIDSIIVRDNGLLHLIFSLPITIKKMKLIKEDISNLLEKIPKNKFLIAANTPKNQVESKSLTTGKIIVGFEEETNLIIRNLTSEPADLDVISITGMPGSGKTTLAYKIYNDKRVSSHFDLRAWCTVDQQYDEKNLLNKIFNQVNGSDSNFSENIDVADKLRKRLYGMRYLIVLDDVWDTTTWDELTRPFPNVMKGSRIILTTRQREVALHGKLYTDPLNLRLLRSEESWELLERKAFGNESCPDELLDVGKEIAENCKGLPLVADLIAGVIAGREKKKTVWVEVRNNLNSFIFNTEEEVMKVIELSYDHLSDQVKPCLLCLASYPKDTALPTSLLIDVLRPEGLVEQTEMKSVEEVMKVYLDNLISSSLVILFNEIGQLPTCQLHDLVHDFCSIKARKEKLFDRISSSAPSSVLDLMPRIVTIDCDSEFFELNNFVLFGSNKKRHSGKYLYSLRITGDELDNSLSDTLHLRHLRLLRVLILDSFSITVKDSLLNEICMLNHLRFLNIGTQVKSLPLSFSNLWNLETLFLDNNGTTLVLLPRIWDLAKLRMLSIEYCCFFDLVADESIVIAEDTKLEKLIYLQKLVLSYSKDAEDIFRRLPNLQQLAFGLKESWDYSTEQQWFPKLDFLTELEGLYVEFESSNTNDSGPSAVTNCSWDFHFPLNLKKMRLSHFALTSDELSTIARLPNLEELSLDDAIFQGEKWNMGEEDTFENLKCLKLRGVTLAKWEVGEESFPALEKLKLNRCCKLEEIPPSFGDINSFKVIKLVESPHLEDSAKKIKEYAEDLRAGGDELQVVGRKNIPL